MKINIINLIDISLVLVLSYILILRGDMSNLCLKGFVVGIVAYHIISKNYNIDKLFLNVKVPEKFEFVGKLINGKTLLEKKSQKIDKVEQFLQTNKSSTYRDPVILTESYSDF